jgi:hypothetical protein
MLLMYEELSRARMREVAARAPERARGQRLAAARRARRRSERAAAKAERATSRLW